MPKTHLPSVLIVDDSLTTRAMIRRILQMTELPIGLIQEAADGSEALLRLEAWPFDLVLADLNMPGMDGFELIRQMRLNEATRHIPVYVISAQPDPELAEQLERDGVAGYLPKPFTAEAVRDLVGPALRSASPEPTTAGGSGHEPFNLALAEALSEALQTMAFIGTELVTGSAVPPLPEGSRLVKIEFKGVDTSGSVALAASPMLGAAMAANLDLATEGADDDVLKELANVTTGLLLRMRPGGGVGFHLAPPQLSTTASTDAAAVLDGKDLVALQADGHLVAAQVKTDAAFYGE